jgi:cell division protein FtsI (penicillin-binding protein 3)
LNVQVSNAKDMEQFHFVAPTNKADIVQLESVPLSKAKVPNVIGMGLRDAMFLLKQQKMKVTVVGRGVVKKQSLPAYTPIKEGARITIELAVN